MLHAMVAVTKSSCLKASLAKLEFMQNYYACEIGFLYYMNMENLLCMIFTKHTLYKFVQ